MKIVTNEIQITERNGGTGGFVNAVLGKKPFIFMWIQALEIIWQVILRYTVFYSFPFFFRSAKQT